ncbi:hypothetical protein DFH07DRAFT_1034906 [Mycena maculata]|uniref:Uncharacterized protein n=1 Tax=Mycena maculata TaxID=230809 RepID=A0AAD7N8V8_9AGAR|nr:hypothetical protein DFH07DRAFT_1034906 [Mycena maculata]
MDRSTDESVAILENIPTLVELRWFETSEMLSRMIIPLEPASGHHPVVPTLRLMGLMQFRPFNNEMLPVLIELMGSRRRSVSYSTLSLCVFEFIINPVNFAGFEFERGTPQPFPGKTARDPTLESFSSVHEGDLPSDSLKAMNSIQTQDHLSTHFRTLRSRLVPAHK